MPDLPVAAPDHAETIRQALTEHVPYDGPYQAALTALLAERQQDKEAAAEYQLRARAAVLVLERHGLRDEYLQAVADQRDAAALAVEEDAE